MRLSFRSSSLGGFGGLAGIAGVLALLVAALAPGRAWASEAKPLGITEFAMEATERTVEKGTEEALEFSNEPYKTPFTQAGGHPWALTTRAAFTTDDVLVPNTGIATSPTRDVKDIVAGLPPGLLGNPMAVPRCPLQVTGTSAQCPADTQIGVWVSHQQGGHELLAPIVNVAPEVGQSAEFALENTVKFDTPLLTAHLVRTATGDYGFTVVSNNIPVINIEDFELTFWGVPADPSHNPMRGRFCRRVTIGDKLTCEGGGQPSGLAQVPFLMMPTDCVAGPETATLRVDSWEEPGSVREGRYAGYAEKSAALPGVTGCNLLRFEPSIETQPDNLLADEPVGMGVELNVPQPEAPGSFATPHVRDAVVTLPEGVSVSPGIVDGIQACDESGHTGINFEGPESEETALNGELQLAPGHCPNASAVGTAEAITPLLGEPVKGHVYLARPLCGGADQSACTNKDALDGHLYQLYLELGGEGELANTGINIKAHGFVEANPATGQLTTKFLNNPQAPFSHLRIKLKGGPRASLDNPATCGPAVTTADFTPWSTEGITPAPESLFMPGTPNATVASPPFVVEGCSSPPAFKPGLVAGTVTPLAGQFSAFTLNLSRQDREQYIKGVQVHTPPGLLGMLANVPLCEEQRADAGNCPEASKIGATKVASGAGSHPFEIGGTVYLTGPYRGAPFGLSIVTNAVAGPFNLGLVIVRARIAVDRETSELTITTDETGPYAVPQIIFGVPLRLQRITVNIDRPNFMFNPTNCSAQQITAVLSGSQDATATVASPFAVGGCKSLAFKPSFKVSTSAKTSRARGASLDVKLSYPKGAMGNDANIAKVKVSLPKQLPSRLNTLQKACPAATFQADPATCPSASIVGVVRATTPLLPVGLSGPVYFVSHGGEAFPSLIVVLQGDNVRVDLTGSTFINKAGITSSTFRSVPDVPVDKFELYLPEGKYSALAANGNLCKLQSKLKMPTEFIAQNGAILKQSTKIAVTGCARSTKAARARAHGTRTPTRPGGTGK
jgi:hypothetical protein